MYTKNRMRLALDAMIPDALETLHELCRYGKDRERLQAASQILNLASESDGDAEIALTAIAPEAISLDMIRAEAERRRSLVSDSNNYRTLETEDGSSKVDLFESLSKIGTEQ